MKKRLMKMATTFALLATMLLSMTVASSAASPRIEDIEFKSNGRIEVDFRDDVRYKNAKVTVKDTSGNKYKVKNIRKDDDEIDFTIRNFKRGKTYKITISGVKFRGAKKYDKVTGTLKVPAAAKGKAISSSTALTTAKNHAKNKWNASDIWDVDVESDRYNGQAVWEVSFNGTINGDVYDFDYKIAKKGGTILRKEKEYDD